MSESFVYKNSHVGVKALYCALDVKGVGLNYMNFWVTSKTIEFMKYSVKKQIHIYYK